VKTFGVVITGRDPQRNSVPETVNEINGILRNEGDYIRPFGFSNHCVIHQGASERNIMITPLAVYPFRLRLQRLNSNLPIRAPGAEVLLQVMMAQKLFTRGRIRKEFGNAGASIGKDRLPYEGKTRITHGLQIVEKLIEQQRTFTNIHAQTERKSLIF
jgi:hypothetical protein